MAILVPMKRWRCAEAARRLDKPRSGYRGQRRPPILIEGTDGYHSPREVRRTVIGSGGPAELETSVR